MKEQLQEDLGKLKKEIIENEKKKKNKNKQRNKKTKRNLKKK